MTKTLLFSFVIITLFSCNKQVKSKVVEKGKTATENLDVKLDVFNSVPDTIDGCGEYYTLENENENSENYIFLSNLSSFAIIKVNGKNVFLEKDSINSKEISKDEYFEVYNGKGYKATEVWR